MKNDLVAHFTWLANKAAEWNTYTNWSGDIVKKEVAEAFQTFYKSLSLDKNACLVDLNNLSVEELRMMRFQRWDEEMPNLWLIPLWFVPLIKPGTELVSIGGDRFVYDGSKPLGEMIDLDIRCGCIAWGIEKEKQNEDS